MMIKVPSLYQKHSYHIFAHYSPRFSWIFKGFFLFALQNETIWMYKILNFEGFWYPLLKNETHPNIRLIDEDYSPSCFVEPLTSVAWLSGARLLGFSELQHFFVLATCNNETIITTNLGWKLFFLYAI